MPKENKLLTAARKARRRAHAPYSRFKVGAALLGASGRTYLGCNVESSSYSLTLCAERTALFKAISEGERRFRAIAIASNGNSQTYPCGACRQVLWDLAGNIDIIVPGGAKGTVTVKLQSLLPKPFDSKSLKRLTRSRK